MNETAHQANRPSKEERLAAMASYDALAETLKDLKGDNHDIQIEESKQKINIPLKALLLLADILKGMSEGKIINLVPTSVEVTTQVAADMLGCSRPHFVKLLESNEIPFTMVGRHRRVKHDDVMKYKLETKKKQEAAIIELMHGDEELGIK